MFAERPPCYVSKECNDRIYKYVVFHLVEQYAKIPKCFWIDGNPLMYKLYSSIV